MYLADFSYTSIITNVLHFALTHNLLKLISPLINRIKRTLNPNTQGPSNPPIIFTTAIAAVLVVTLACKALPPSKDIDTFIGRFSKVGACCGSVEKMFSVGSGLGQTISDFFYYQVNGTWPQRDDMMEPFDSFCDRVQRMYTVDFEAKIIGNVAMCTEIERLLLDCDKLLKTRDTLKIPQSQLTRFHNAIVVLHKMRTAAAIGGSADEPRIGAMIVQAYGATGVGKSALLHYMNTDLLIANGCNDPKDLTDRVHYRASGSEYFDGCNNHVIGFVIDDYGMVRDSLGKPNTDATNVVRASNSAPWRLEMSDVVYKGKVAFKAKYVILTSNVKEFNFSQSLSNAEAVQRRIDFRFEVLVKDEFALIEDICGKKVRRLDEAKVEEVVKINPEAMREVWEFKTDEDEIIDYDEMMKRCIKIMESKIIRGNRMLDQVKNYFRQKVIDKKEAELNETLDKNIWDIRRDDARDYYASYPYSNTQGLIYVEPNAAFSPSWNPFKCYVHLDKIREYVYSGAHNECFESRHFELDEDYMELPQLRPSPLRSSRTALVPTRLVKDFVGAYITTVRTHCKGIIDFEKTFKKYYTGSYELGTVYEPDEERKSLIGRMMNTVNFSMTKKWSTIGFTVVGLAMAYAFAKLAMKVGSTMIEVGKKLTAKLIRTEYAKKERFYLPQWAFMLHPEWSVMDLWRKYKQPERTEETGLPKNLLKNEIEHLKNTQQFETAKELENYLKHETQSHQEVTRGPRKMNVQSERTLVKIDDIDFTKLNDKENSVLISKYGTVHLCSVHSEKIGASHLFCDECVVLTDFDSGETQAERDQNAEELKIILAKNCFRMFAETNREHDYWISPGTMTVLQGRVAMCNIHTLRACKDKKMLIVNSAYPQGFEFEYKDLNIAEQPEEHRDIALIELPPHFPTMRSIMNSIVTREDISRMREVSGISLVGYSKENYFKVTETDKAAHGVDFLANDGINGSFLIRKCYKYAIPTIVGDCGSVVLINNRSMARKICGIHVAGCNGQFSGVGIAFTKEYILENLPKIRRKESWLDGTVSIPTGAAQAEMSDIELVKEGEMIAKMPPQFNPTKTNIRKSPLHGIFPVVTKPAHLKPVLVDGRWIDPMALGREKVFTPNYYFDETVLDRCVENYKQLLFKTVEPCDRNVLTKEESIQGLPGVEFYEPIKRSTSPGYGWKSDKPGKTEWLGADDYILDDPELERVRSQMLQNVKEGRRSGTIWTDTLKDERRPIEKVNQGKTRLFAASEMAYVVLFRQYFMGFAAHMARNRIDVESCVGVNPYSYDWTKLARRLAAVGNNIVAGDFSNYDGTLSGQVLWKCLDTINEFYGDSEENQSIRRALWMDIVHSVHVGRFGNKSYLYVWSHSQPSGCPITAILNSLYHSIVARYVYVMAAHKYAPDFIPLENFNRYVAHNNFGDDDLYSISDEIVDWYNQETMTELFPLVGMTYTDEAKSGKCVKSRKLEEVAFLKRGFRYVKEEGRYQCPLSLDTIREMAMWCKGGVDQQLVTAETLVEAVEELARHPREVFEELIPTFRLGTKRLELPPVLMSYDEYCEKDLLRNFIQEKSIPLNQIRTIPMNPRSTKQDKKTVSVFNCGLIQADTTPATIPKPEESLQEERYGPVIFAEDGDVAETPDVEVLVQNITNTNLVDEYTLKSFLERPYRISSFVIDKQTPGTKISSINIPKDFLAIRSISKKLEGFRFLKCNFKIRVQVNAQPFQAGRLLLFFDPNWQDTVHALSNMDSLSGMTGYPHVELDFSENTSAELTVPFIPAIAGYDLVSKTGGGGAVHIVIYGACANGPVSATVFIRATDVEISVPTSGSVQADKEERKRPGNIETISKSVGSVAKMASMIPGAGAIAAPVSAVADAVGGLASIFGFSKPVDPEFPTEVAPCLGRYMTNFNGDSKSKMLALDARNTVKPPTGCTWSDQDELSVAYVMQRPCYYNSFTLDTNQKEGHFVYETEVAPSVFQTVLSDKILYVQNNTFLSYFGNIFEYWRGGIKFTLKFVKTNYHSGRVRVSFSPGASNNASATTEVSFDYSKIIDLREGTTFEFVCPYSAPSPWLGTGQDIGRFRVEVINSLVASSVAASSIVCLVEVSGAEDFQWAVPMRTDHYIPRIGKELPMPKPSEDEGDVQMDIAPVQKLDYAANEVTTGEVVASFRQLLKRYELTTALTVEIPLYTGSGQTYKGRTPDLVDAQIKSDSTDNGYATAPVSYYSWIRNCYRFWNGSHRLGIPLNSKIGHRIVGMYENGMNLDNMVNAFAVPSLEGLTEVAIPFYSQFALSRVFVTGCTEGLKQGDFSHLPVVIKKVWVEGETTDEDEHFFRAVGEDFNFFYLVGPPQTMVRKLT